MVKAATGSSPRIQFAKPKWSRAKAMLKKSYGKITRRQFVHLNKIINYENRQDQTNLLDYVNGEQNEEKNSD